MLEGTIPYLKRALLVAVVLGGFFVVAQSANAQLPNNPDISTEPTITGGLPNNPDISTEPPLSLDGVNIGGGRGTINPSPEDAAAAQAAAEAAAAAAAEQPPVIVKDSDSCWGSPPGFFHCIMVSFFGSFVAIAGYALDWSIHLFITQFGQMYIEYGIGAVVEGTWGTVRDIFNLTFIFGLVYIGFQIILGINESSAKRTIPLLIVAALLVNFSLFVVKFIVDFANLTALQIYNLFGVAKALGEGKEVVGEAAGGAIDVLGTFGPSISLAFINTIGVTSLLSHGPGADTAEGVPMFYTFGMIVVFLVLIYVFFAAAILITIRFAALTFYMIFSPIMFLGWVFPGMKKYSDQFWHGLFGQAFFAPALLFMLYITYQLSAGLAGDGLNREGGAAFENKADALDFAQFVPYLILIVVFLMASLIVAKKMANQGASMVGKVNDWALGKASGLARGGGNVALGGAGWASYKTMDKMAQSENGTARAMGRTLTFLGARDKAEKAFKGSAQGRWKENRKKQEGAMATRSSDAETKKKIKQYAGTGGADLEQAVRGASTDQVMSVLRNYEVGGAEYNNIVDSLTHEQRKKILDSTDDKVNATERRDIGSRASQRIATDIASGSTDVSKLTPKQIDTMGRVWIKDNLKTFTASQVEKMANDSSVLGEAEKSSLKRDWSEAITTLHGTGGFDYAKFMSGRNAKDVAALPAEVLTDQAAVPYLTDKVLREIAATNMSTHDRDKINANVTHLGGPGAGYFSSTNNHYKNNW